MWRSLASVLLTILLELIPSGRSQADMDLGTEDQGGGNEDVLDSSLIDLASDQGIYDTGFGGGGSGKNSIENLKMQTLLALQELGIVIGVAFMVASIFVLMVYTEKVVLSLRTKYRKHFGGQEEEDVEADPAALVGTFKRYKN